MSQNRTLSQLGLCRRAGKMQTGEEPAMYAIMDRSAKLIIISTDISEQTLKKITDKCKTYQVPYVQLFDRYEIGSAVGHAARVVVAITDEGFATMIRRSLETNTEVKGI
jgi:ribosomal protein L7Ae-like RNA K-turn-binding protein